MADVQPTDGISEDLISRAAKALEYEGRVEVVEMFVKEGMSKAIATQAVAAGFLLISHQLKVQLGLMDIEEEEETQV